MRRVRPYPFDRLPRVARNQVEAGRSFRAHLPLGVGASFAEIERALGGAIRFQLVECFVARARDLEALLAGVVIRLAATAERWCLLIADRPLAVALAGCALGVDRERTPELPAPRRPTLAEAGALELLVQLLVEGHPVQVVGMVESEDLLGLVGALHDDALVHVLEARVSSPVGEGAARLIVPESLSLALAAARPPKSLLRRSGRLSALRVTTVLELARVSLPGAQLAELGAGDVLAFDAAAPRVGEPIAITLRVGRGGHAAIVSGDGVQILEPYRINQGVDMSQDPPARTSDEPGADQLLRELPIEIVCELGRVKMSGRELLELEPGAVVPVARPLAGPIDLTVGGRVVARGELVDIEGDLGVRVTEILD